jgi:hypothetical protein
VGSRSIELRANGYKPHRQTVEIQEGKVHPIAAALQEEEKTGSLRIAANISNAAVSIDGRHVGYTPTVVSDLLLGRKEVSFQASGYKPLTQTVTIMPGYNTTYGELKAKKVIRPVLFLEYRLSPPTSYFGLSIGYCKRLGAYFQYRTDLLRTGDSFLKEDMLQDAGDYFYGGEKKYFRSSITGGGMLRLFSFMYVYGGLGYGKYGAVYQEGDDSYAIFYSDGLIKGLELEYGAILKLWKFSFTAGYSTINKSNFGELHFGVGLAI